MNKMKTIAAMPGNPSFYNDGLQDYSEEAVLKLKQYGINTIFINLAWSRPHIDIVNLEHIACSASFPAVSNLEEVQKNRQKLSERLLCVKKIGLRAMLLVGVPQYFDYSELPDNYKILMGATASKIANASVTCVESPATIIMYQELLADLLMHLPELDGMLIYTYDELAEICDEDSDCPRCHGIPQEIRISKFLNTLYTYTRTLKPDFDIWWEPWELTWAQVYRTLELLHKDITVACHSTLHEVYFANHPDLWFRSIAALCKEQGRNMIGELFMGGTGEDLGFTAMYPCPRLVYEQIITTASTPGITGIKEYYGICPKYISINEKVMQACLAGAHEYDSLIWKVAEYYTTTPDALCAFWEYTSRALEILPWEISWCMRFYNYHPYDSSYWGKISFADMMKTPWSTPSWLSNRRSYYMISENTENMNETYCSDVIKRFDICVELLEKALHTAESICVNDIYLSEWMLQQESVYLLRLFILCRRNHLKMSWYMEKLKNGIDFMDEIRILLNHELENAHALKNLLQNSTVPYLLSVSILDDGISAINTFIAETEVGIEKVIDNHKFL